MNRRASATAPIRDHADAGDRPPAGDRGAHGRASEGPFSSQRRGRGAHRRHDRGPGAGQQGHRDQDCQRPLRRRQMDRGGRARAQGRRPDQGGRAPDHRGRQVDRRAPRPDRVELPPGGRHQADQGGDREPGGAAWRLHRPGQGPTRRPGRAVADGRRTRAPPVRHGRSARSRRQGEQPGSRGGGRAPAGEIFARAEPARAAARRGARRKDQGRRRPSRGGRPDRLAPAPPRRSRLRPQRAAWPPKPRGLADVGQGSSRRAQNEIEVQIANLTREVAAMRQAQAGATAGFADDPTMLQLRDDVASMARMVGKIASQPATPAFDASIIEARIDDLGSRIDGLRQSGASETAIRSVENHVAEMIRAIGNGTHRELSTIATELRSITAKLDQIGEQKVASAAAEFDEAAAWPARRHGGAVEIRLGRTDQGDGGAGAAHRGDRRAHPRPARCRRRRQACRAGRGSPRGALGQIRRARAAERRRAGGRASRHRGQARSRHRAGHRPCRHHEAAPPDRGHPCARRPIAPARQPGGADAAHRGPVRPGRGHGDDARQDPGRPEQRLARSDDPSTRRAPRNGAAPRRRRPLLRRPGAPDRPHRRKARRKRQHRPGPVVDRAHLVRSLRAARAHARGRHRRRRRRRDAGRQRGDAASFRTGARCQRRRGRRAPSGGFPQLPGPVRPPHAAHPRRRAGQLSSASPGAWTSSRTMSTASACRPIPSAPSPLRASPLRRAPKSRPSRRRRKRRRQPLCKAPAATRAARLSRRRRPRRSVTRRNPPCPEPPMPRAGLDRSGRRHPARARPRLAPRFLRPGADRRRQGHVRGGRQQRSARQLHCRGSPRGAGGGERDGPGERRSAVEGQFTAAGEARIEPSIDFEPHQGDIVAESAEKTPARSPIERMRVLYSRRKRPILLGIAAVVVALGTIQIAKLALPSPDDLAMPATAPAVAPPAGAGAPRLRAPRPPPPPPHRLRPRCRPTPPWRRRRAA